MTVGESHQGNESVKNLKVTQLQLLENHKNELKLALCDIEKLLASRKTKFQAGKNGLQSY